MVDKKADRYPNLSYKITVEQAMGIEVSGLQFALDLPSGTRRQILNLLMARDFKTYQAELREHFSRTVKAAVLDREPTEDQIKNVIGRMSLEGLLTWKEIDALYEALLGIQSSDLEAEMAKVFELPAGSYPSAQEIIELGINYSNETKESEAKPCS